MKCFDVEGTSDVFISGRLNDKGKDGLFSDTDTHYRCKTGRASFNYRFLFHTTDSVTRAGKTILNLQARDLDIFSANDLIGSADLNLTSLVKDCANYGKSILLDKKYLKKYKFSPSFYNHNSFWIPLKNSKGKTSGKIRITVEAVPQVKASK